MLQVMTVCGKGGMRKGVSESWCGANWGKAGGCFMELILLHLKNNYLIIIYIIRIILLIIILLYGGSLGPFTSTLGCGAFISSMRLCSKRALADSLINQDFGIWLVLGVLEAPKTNYLMLSQIWRANI